MALPLHLPVALSMPAAGSAGQLCGRAGNSVGTCEGEDDTERGGGGGVALKPWEGVCAGARLLAQAWHPWLCLLGAPAHSPQRPCSLDTDARAHGMRVARCGCGCGVLPTSSEARGDTHPCCRKDTQARPLGSRCLGRDPAYPHLPPRHLLGRPLAPAC